jgi:hypothetical protein
MATPVTSQHGHGNDSSRVTSERECLNMMKSIHYYLECHLERKLLSCDYQSGLDSLWAKRYRVSLIDGHQGFSRYN